jgi:hypothetical protein
MAILKSTGRPRTKHAALLAAALLSALDLALPSVALAAESAAIVLAPNRLDIRTENMTVTDVAGSQTSSLFGIGGDPVLYVAPNGNDSWSGGLAEPNAANSDGPFATLDHARSVVRSFNGKGVRRVHVRIRGGTYYLPATVQFSAADSGSATTEIVYENYPGEKPVFSGGMRVTNWTNVGGNQWQTTLPPSTQYFENLFYNGVRRLRPRLGGYLGTYYRIVGPVYDTTAPGPPAHAPNAACSSYVTGKGWECFDRFIYNPMDPISSSWKNLAPAADNQCLQPTGNPALAGDIELLDFQKYDAAKLRISCVDTTNNIVYVTAPATALANATTAYGFLPTHRYVVENVQDALTEPGQWFLDRSMNPWTLTYLTNPGENPNDDTVIIPQLTQVLVASNLAYVTFRGLDFEHDNYTVPATTNSPLLGPLGVISAAVSFQNSQHITFDASIVAHTSGAGLDFVSCISAQSPSWCVSTDPNASTSNNTIENSAFYDIGAMGVRIGIQALVADTEANLPQFTTFRSNVVEGWGRIFPSLWGITQGEGHDNLYTHNDIYDGYHSAFALCMCSGANLIPDSHDNVVSFNHAYNLEQGIMNDDGALYMQTRNNQEAPSPTGNKMVNNLVHDVNDASVLDPEDGYGGDGIYVDTESGAVDVENNLVYRVSGNAMNFAAAPSMPNEPSTVKNNIFAFARGSMINVSSPYLSGTVPPSVEQIFVATNNLMYFDRNSSSSPAFYVQGGCTYSGGFAFTSWEEWNSNMYWRTDGGFSTDTQAFHYQPNPAAENPCYFNEPSQYTFLTFAGWQATGEDVLSLVQNPGFKNPAYPNDDYFLRNGSPGVGFVPFDANRAGRTNPEIQPPPIPATFLTMTFNPATDF